MNDELVLGAKKYIELVHEKFGGCTQRVLMAVRGCYGDSHEQDFDEPDSSYIERCLEQDFADGFNGAAMFQDLFEQARSGCEITP